MAITRAKEKERREKEVQSSVVVREKSASMASSSEDGHQVNDYFSDRFHVLEEIGSGSFGSVFRGIDRGTGSEVAIKMEKSRKGKPSSIAIEAMYYKALLGIQDMNEDLVAQNGHPDVRMYHFEGEQSSVEALNGQEGWIEDADKSKEEEELDSVQNVAESEDGKSKEQNENLEVSLGIPKLIYFGKSGTRNVIVMEMLGQNLEKLFNVCNRHFGLKTVTQIAVQLLDRIEFIHSKGLLHRDIKPENFVIGKPGGADITIRNTLHIVDFGLSKFYINQRTQRHNEYIAGKELTGTARYVSLRTHEGYEQSRRDDIEAIGHMLIYFMRGSLPWQGLKMTPRAGLEPKAMNKLRYKKIEERKKGISIQELCSGLPQEFNFFLSYARHTLGYEDEPDYEHLREMFTRLRQDYGFPDDHVYDWDCVGEEVSQDQEDGYQSLSNIKVRGSEQRIL